MAYQNSISVNVFVSGGATPTQFVFDDSISAGAGSAALAALERKDQIDAMGKYNDEDPKRVIIPYESVVAAQIVVERTTVDDPVDANCN